MIDENVEYAFTIYPEWVELGKGLPPADKAEFFECLVDYGISGKYLTDNQVVDAILKSMIVPQIDKARAKTQKINQKYDNEKIFELAIQGKSQEEICLALGYDVAKKRSLSSNKGYREGITIYRNKMKNGIALYGKTKKEEN